MSVPENEDTVDFSSTIAWYSENAKTYADSISRVVSLDQIESFIKHLEPGLSVLDVGCNAGRDLGVFQQLGYQAYGIDLVHEALELAKGKCQRVFESNFLTIPFRDSSFDGLWVRASIHHLDYFYEVMNAIKEFSRVTKKNGIIHLATQARVGRPREAVVFDTLAKANRHYIYLSKGEVEDMLQGCGFELITSEQHRELDTKVNTGRVGVEWIVALARKK
ncbi:MAG: class I SAM-dependent methyltransferase [bacterium]